MELLLLSMTMLAISSSSRVQREEGVLSKPIISYKIIKIFPRSRLVHILCHSIQGPPMINYILMGTSDITVSKKIMDNGLPASFPILATFKSRPDLLNYYCQASTAMGQTAYSDILKLFWELWVPVSQPQANFTLMGTGSGQMVVVSCLASKGSPPITYMLCRKDGYILMEKTPRPGRPANFSFPVNELSAWYACQAKNFGSIQYSALTLVPPDELISIKQLAMTSFGMEFQCDYHEASPSSLAKDLSRCITIVFSKRS
ncbi:protein IL-40 isoform X2 [Dromiciops gliroides]|uniref:protein IL-40 isoform X2 n=1 Tax=Dromiciops gliroides TaxID=33562 RepID=UPI001CC5E128|nr:protein IL-40 isoform X2 [Dromiciops gliroides]